MTPSNLNILSILIGTSFFVAGQVYLRKSFSKDQDFLHTWCVFCITLGLVAFMVLLTPMNTTILSNIEKNKNAVIAGVLFALGNLFWIYSISTKTSIGSIRTIMAGFETALLFLVGYFLFSETFDVKKIIGIIMVLLGIYLIG